ncbi:hypothetical protein NDI39_29745, partial [Microcoleus sp. ZQ-A2]|nr:hypothetical protein [Microcoleus sp. FACHB-1]
MTTYLERLSPWCLVRLFPNMQRLTVGRFRRWNDAHEHMRILRQLVPEANYAIVFDPGLEQQHSPE